MPRSLLSRASSANNVLRDGGRKAERGLVAHQDARLGHQRACDREHLLLAAGKAAGRLVAPRREPGKDAVPVVERAADRALVAQRVGAEREILLHGEIHEGAAPLRDVRDAELRALARRRVR